MTWVGALDLTEVIVGIEEGQQQQFLESCSLESQQGQQGLIDRGVNLTAPNRSTKSSILVMASLEYVLERNNPLLKFPSRYKGSHTFGSGSGGQQKGWRREGNREGKKKKCAKLVVSMAEAQGRGDPQHQVLVSVSQFPSDNNGQRKGVGRLLVKYPAVLELFNNDK